MADLGLLSSQRTFTLKYGLPGLGDSYGTQGNGEPRGDWNQVPRSLPTEWLAGFSDTLVLLRYFYPASSWKSPAWQCGLQCLNILLIITSVDIDRGLWTVEGTLMIPNLVKCVLQHN